MPNAFRRLIAASCALAALSSLVTAAFADADDVALRGYTLSMDKIRKYHDVVSALKNSNDPAVRAEMPRIDNLLGGSVSQGLAKLHRAPHIEAVIHRGGLGDTDFVLIPAVSMGAAMAQYGSPAARAKMPVSAANIAFVQQHQKEIAAMMH